MIAKCECSHCAGHIEFDPAELEKTGETSYRIIGQTIDCPHCAQPTPIYIPRHTPAPPALPPPVLARPVTTSTGEIIFFQNQNMLVSDSRFVIGPKTFALRGITSVEAVRIPPSSGGPVLLIIIGVLLLAVGLMSLLPSDSNNSNQAWPFSIFLMIIGGPFLALGMYLNNRLKPSFEVRLRTAGGEVMACRSQDPNQIEPIVRALNQAMTAANR